MSIFHFMICWRCDSIHHLIWCVNRCFLLENLFYSLEKVTEYMSAVSHLVPLLIEISIRRKFTHSAIDHLYHADKLTSEILTPFVYSGDLTTVLDTVANGKVALILDARDMCCYLLCTQRIRLDVCQSLINELDSLSQENIISLLRYYDPSSHRVRQAVIDLVKDHPINTSKIYCSTDALSTDVRVPSNERSTSASLQVYQQLYTFLVSLLLQHSYYSPHRYLLASHIDEMLAEKKALPTVCWSFLFSVWLWKLYGFMSDCITACDAASNQTAVLLIIGSIPPR